MYNSTSTASGDDVSVITPNSGVGRWLRLTVASSGYTDEQAQDAIGTILTDTTTIDLTYNDSSNTITAAVITGSITNTHISSSAAIAPSKIAGLVTDLAAINAEIDTKADSGHTHTSGDITNFNEAVQDVVGSFLIQGTNISLNYDDVANTLTISATTSGGGGLGDWDDLYDASTSNWDSEY